ncbi:MAG: Hsp20/alpha crystallin family protein [Chloroflexi bacterium]|nr:Hsp20/alpha crystallin family protein [Chloroflexota bacterium]
MSTVRRRHTRETTIRELAGRLFEEAFTLPSLRRVSPEGRQVLPVNMYETDVDLIIVAPMPGIHPEDVEVTIRGDTLTIRGAMRGSLEETKNYQRHEWHYGPYARIVTLPFLVNPDKANARLGNGVLTLALPKAEVAKTKTIKLQRLSPTEGELARHGAPEFAPEEHEHVVSRTRGRSKKAQGR